MILVAISNQSTGNVLDRWNLSHKLYAGQSLGRGGCEIICILGRLILPTQVNTTWLLGGDIISCLARIEMYIPLQYLLPRQIFYVNNDERYISTRPATHDWGLPKASVA